MRPLKTLLLTLLCAGSAFGGVNVQQQDSNITIGSMTLTSPNAGILWPNGIRQSSAPVVVITPGTGLTGGGNADSAGNVIISLSTPIAVAHGGTGTAAPGLIAGSNVSITGSWPNQTISASGGGGGGGGGGLTFSSFTATNPVLYDNAGTFSLSQISLSTSVTGSLPASKLSGQVAVANGGTGTNSPSLVAGTGITVGGSWPNQTVTATGGGGSGSGLTYSSFTATNPVLYNGSGGFSLAPVSLSTAVTGALPATSLSGQVPVANGGTGTSSPNLTGGTGVTIAGAWPNQTINASLTYSSFSATNPIIYNNATGALSLSQVSLSTSVTGTLPVANGGTGTASPNLVAGTGVTISGSWPNQTVNASIGGSGLTYSSFTATNPVLYNGAGGFSLSQVSLSTSVTGVLAVANGGTGTAAPGLVAGSNVSVTGSWPNQTVSAGGGSGTSSLAVAAGQVVKSSPTAIVSVDSNTMNATLQGTATAFLTLNSSSVTLQGNSVSLSGLVLSTTSLQTTLNTKINLSSVTASQPAFYNSGTGVISVTGVSLSSSVVGTLPLANGGTGSTSPNLTAGTGITISGSWPNQTINASIGGSGLTYSSFTATNPVLYDGSGGFSLSQVSLSTSVTGTLPVAKGGTGTTTPGLIAGTNITSITGTWPNQTINASGGGAGGGGGYNVEPATVTFNLAKGLIVTTVTANAFNATTTSVTITGDFGIQSSSAAQSYLTEGAESTVTGSGAGIDTLWADSTAHALKVNLNNGTTAQVVVSSVTPTANHLAAWSGTGKLIDGGAIPTGGGSVPASSAFQLLYSSNNAIAALPGSAVTASSATVPNWVVNSNGYLTLLGPNPANYLQFSLTDSLVTFQFFQNGVANNLFTWGSVNGYDINNKFVITGANNTVSVQAAITSADSAASPSLADPGIVDLWSTGSKPPYIAYSETGIANRGYWGFPAGKSDMVLGTGSNVMGSGTTRFSDGPTSGLVAFTSSTFNGPMVIRSTSTDVYTLIASTSPTSVTTNPGLYVSTNGWTADDLFVGRASTVTVVTGTGAGNSGTPHASVTGTNNWGALTVNTATTPSASAVIATITPSIIAPTKLICTVSPGNSATVVTSTGVYVTSSSTTWTLNSGTSGLVGSTLYLWNYNCGGY